MKLRIQNKSLIVFAVVLASLVIGTFPIATQQVIAQTIQTDSLASEVITGRVVRVVAEGFEDANFESQSWFMLQTVDQKLYFLDGKYDFAAAEGQLAKVVGVIDGDRIVVSRFSFKRRPIVTPGEFPRGQKEFDSDSKDFRPSLENFLVMPDETRGTRSVYVVNVNFLDDPTESATPEEVYAAVFGISNSVSNFYREASLGKFGLVGVVHPVWITIPFSNQNCLQNMTTTWSNAVDAIMAGNPQWANAQSKVINYTFNPSCIVGAAATVGSKGQNSPGRVWAQLRALGVGQNLTNYQKAIAHEIGHNSGLDHAGGITIPGVISDSTDRADVMGAKFRFPNLYNRLSYGWTAGKITTLAGPGTYRVDLFPSYQVFNKGSKGVIVELREASGALSSKFVSVELRSDYLYDGFGPQYRYYTEGVSIRYGEVDMVPSSSRPLLLDTTLDSPLGFDDAPLAPGQSFTDAQYGFTITVPRNRTGSRGIPVEFILTR